MANLPIPSNPVTEIGTTVVKESFKGFFSCMKHAETEKTNRAAIRAQVDKYVADVESETTKIVADLQGQYEKHNNALNGLFILLQNAKTEEEHNRYLQEIINITHSSALANTERERASVKQGINTNFGKEKEVFDA